jgi:uncharacterized membrane protein
VASRRSGYLQAVDEPTLMGMAEVHDLRIRVRCRPGDFVRQGRPLLFLTPRDISGDLAERLQSTFFVGAQPTDEQDPEFAIKQLVEIAVRALSRGINDPFTAIHCVDWLGVELAGFASDPLPSPFRYGRGGELRIITRAFTFAGLVDAAFDQLRQHARDDLSVTLRVFEALANLGAALRSEEQRRAVRRQVQLVYEGACPASAREDSADLRDRYHAALAALRPRRA